MLSPKISGNHREASVFHAYTHTHARAWFHAVGNVEMRSGRGTKVAAGEEEAMPAM